MNSNDNNINKNLNKYNKLNKSTFTNRIKSSFSDFFNYEPENTYDFVLSPENDTSIPPDKEKKVELFYNSLNVNKEIICTKYNTLINSDVIVRDFILHARGKQYKATLIYIDGMVDSNLINDFILKPLILANQSNTQSNNLTITEAISSNISVKRTKSFSLSEYILNCLIPQNSVTLISKFDDLSKGINSGNCALLVDTLNIAFNLDVKGFKQRSLESSNSEIIIRGSQEGFNEIIRTNTSILRRLINNENLIIESLEIGSISKTSCAICYMKNIVNPDLVNEVKYRLNNIDIDYLISSGQLEHLIEDNSSLTLPQILATERPDKTSHYILQGRVAIIVNGNPYVLVVPGIFTDFISSPEDFNINYHFSNMLKTIRIISILITLFLPAFYMAITNFHEELLPTELLLAIVSSREAVPFPIILELITMEFSFELIREAGIRVPAPLGPTIGIVGALILGQAAVEANIVSPILIIIIALTGIASFAIPDFSLAFHCRLLRFIYVVLGYLLDFLGIAIGIFIHLTIMCTLKSFGVSYIGNSSYKNTKFLNGIFLSPPWKREKRDSFLNTKKINQQNHISMRWKYKNKGEES